MPEHILIVEDEPALQDILAYSLKKEGYAVEAVGDGRAALESACRFKPETNGRRITSRPDLDGTLFIIKPVLNGTTRFTLAAIAADGICFLTNPI